GCCWTACRPCASRTGCSGPASCCGAPARCTWSTPDTAALHIVHARREGCAMNATEILEQTRDTLTVRRVYGEPIERDGMLVVPVASVTAGGGAGAGEGRPGPD